VVVLDEKLRNSMALEGFGVKGFHEKAAAVSVNPGRQEPNSWK
jgi:hypothetical protein